MGEEFDMKSVKEFVESSEWIFWDRLSKDLNVIDTKDGTNISMDGKILRGLLFLHYKLKALEKEVKKNGKIL